MSLMLDGDVLWRVKEDANLNSYLNKYVRMSVYACHCGWLGPLIWCEFFIVWLGADSRITATDKNDISEREGNYKSQKYRAKYEK